ncbi:hypothetical protein [Bacillus sp. AK128]
MKQIDWQLVYFVGGSLLKDLWLYVGFPKVYYWELNQAPSIQDEDDRKSA